jgi:8-oxo-dGTP pyrophosphatase MutT (NUDIX family)
MMKKSDALRQGAEAALTQYAALCFRSDPDSGTEVLLITSRETGRWVLPKGWPMRSRSAGECALREAFEEAGVQGDLSGDCLGVYGYLKLMDDGKPLPCMVSVYPVRVSGLRNKFPEQGQRERAWFTPARAAELVAEPELKQILGAFTAV